MKLTLQGYPQNFDWAPEIAPQKQGKIVWGLEGGRFLILTSHYLVAASLSSSLFGWPYEVRDYSVCVRFRVPPRYNIAHSQLRVCCREGSVSTKQIVFLQRPCLPQKIKKKESKVSDLDGFPQVFFAGFHLRVYLSSAVERAACSNFQGLRAQGHLSPLAN